MVDARSGLVVNISSGDGAKYRGSVMYDVAKTAVDRMAKAMAHELRDYTVAAVSLYPGFVRTERVVRAFEEAGEDVPEETHSPEYVGRAVTALAADVDVMDKSGQILVTGALAREYDFTDTDGTRPPPFELESEVL
jgi:NAD(P)-dependent dehydrogenase (short-subunit alcohol dehydrogenase family)